MRFSQMISLFYARFRENSSNSAFSEDRVKQWINEGYRLVTGYTLWDFLIKESVNKNVFTNCSDSGTSTGTTLYVDSCDNMQKGMGLWVSDGSNFEKVEIASFNAVTNVVTLISPGLSGEYTNGDYVISPDLFLPVDCRKLLDIRILSQNSATESGTLIYCDLRDLDILFPHRSSISKPTHYALGGIIPENEAFPNGYLAEASTNSSRIVCSSLTGSNSTYYDNWKVINTTRSSISYISSYEPGGKILEIDPIISSQESGDEFYLVRDTGRIILYPVPDSIYKVKFRYYRKSKDLVLDNDIPLLGVTGENFHDLPVDYALAEAYLVDRNLDMSNTLRDKFFNRLEQFKQQYSTTPDRLINFKLPGKQNLPGFYI